MKTELVAAMEDHNIGIICMKGCEPLCKKIEYYLKSWNNIESSLRIKIDFPRFSSGEAKAVLEESVRGRDLFVISDPFNYSVTYKLRGQDIPLSPDEHFGDLKRAIAAVAGKAKRISVVMPMLYEGRQHKRNKRESLDCAMALKELVHMGVTNIVTFDAHDPRVCNAIPLSGFDNMQPTYQMIKTLVKKVPDIELHSDSTMVVSPDVGGVGRCLDYSSILHIDLGMFYKRRDAENVVDGKNPVVNHEYIGNSPEGKNVIIADDIISSGNSLVDSFESLSKYGAKNIYAFITFGLFTDGVAIFDKAYKEGLFSKIFITNLTYLPDEFRSREWLVEVDLSKYTAYVIDSIYHEASVGKIIEPKQKIIELLKACNKI